MPDEPREEVIFSVRTRWQDRARPESVGSRFFKVDRQRRILIIWAMHNASIDPDVSDFQRLTNSQGISERERQLLHINTHPSFFQYS
jgi:hypothetical protein